MKIKKENLQAVLKKIDEMPAEELAAIMDKIDPKEAAKWAPLERYILNSHCDGVSCRHCLYRGTTECSSKTISLSDITEIKLSEPWTHCVNCGKELEQDRREFGTCNKDCEDEMILYLHGVEKEET